MKRRGIAAACVVAFGLAGSAFGSPSIFMYSEGRCTLREDVFPQFADSTDFGNVIIGGGMKDYSYIIRNQGDTELMIDSIIISWLGPAGWSFVNPPGGFVAPNDITTLTIRLTPPVTGAHLARITVNTDDPDNPNFNFFVAGSGALFNQLKPNLAMDSITGTNIKIVEKNDFSYLSGTYLVPIKNVGQGRSDRKVPVVKVFSSSDTFLDSNDSKSLKVYPIKKDLEVGVVYLMRVKVKVPMLPGAKFVIFQIETPDDYESFYNNNVMSVPRPSQN